MKIVFLRRRSHAASRRWNHLPNKNVLARNFFRLLKNTGARVWDLLLLPPAAQIYSNVNGKMFEWCERRATFSFTSSCGLMISVLSVKITLVYISPAPLIRFAFKPRAYCALRNSFYTFYQSTCGAAAVIKNLLSRPPVASPSLNRDDSLCVALGALKGLAFCIEFVFSSSRTILQFRVNFCYACYGINEHNIMTCGSAFCHYAETCEVACILIFQHEFWMCSLMVKTEFNYFFSFEYLI